MSGLLASLALIGGFLVVGGLLTAVFAAVIIGLSRWWGD
jgi:hypothetical protein